MLKNWVLIEEPVLHLAATSVLSNGELFKNQFLKIKTLLRTLVGDGYTQKVKCKAITVHLAR